MGEASTRPHKQKCKPSWKHEIRIFATVPKCFLHIWRMVSTYTLHFRCCSQAFVAYLAHGRYIKLAFSLRLPTGIFISGAWRAHPIGIFAAVPKRVLNIWRLFCGQLQRQRQIYVHNCRESIQLICNSRGCSVDNCADSSAEQLRECQKFRTFSRLFCRHLHWQRKIYRHNCRESMQQI
jgi:hypothetical protein